MTKEENEEKVKQVQDAVLIEIPKMKNETGTIHIEIRCYCPHCGELQYTDNDEFRKEFTEVNEVQIHHDSFDKMNNIVVRCTDCKHKFEIEKLEYDY